MKDLMMDIETLGTNKGCVIVQIGACYFDRLTGEIGGKFKVNIDIEDSLDNGFTVSGNTLEWWLSQSKEAQESIISKPKVGIREALEMFSGFAKGAKAIWSHATFDAPIVSYAYNHCGLKMPMHYVAFRDIRTLVDLASLDYKSQKQMFPREGVHHDALDDCLYQVKYLSHCMRTVKRVQWGEDDKDK